jgi:hypothetical protein
VIADESAPSEKKMLVCFETPETELSVNRTDCPESTDIDAILDHTVSRVLIGEFAN